MCLARRPGFLWRSRKTLCWCAAGHCCACETLCFGDWAVSNDSVMRRNVFANPLTHTCLFMENTHTGSYDIHSHTLRCGDKDRRWSDSQTMDNGVMHKVSFSRKVEFQKKLVRDQSHMGNMQVAEVQRRMVICFPRCIQETSSFLWIPCGYLREHQKHFCMPRWRRNSLLTCPCLSGMLHTSYLCIHYDWNTPQLWSLSLLI